MPPSTPPTFAELVNEQIRDARKHWLLLQRDIEELKQSHSGTAFAEHMEALESRFPDLLAQADAKATRGSAAQGAITSLVNLATSPTKQSSPLGKAVEAAKALYGAQQGDDNLLQFIKHASSLSGSLAIIGTSVSSVMSSVRTV